MTRFLCRRGELWFTLFILFLSRQFSLSPILKNEGHIDGLSNMIKHTFLNLQYFLMVSVSLLVLVAHVRLLRSLLNLIEGWNADQEANGKCSVQPVVLVVEFVWELHDLGCRGQSPVFASVRCTFLGNF